MTLTHTYGYYCGMAQIHAEVPDEVYERAKISALRRHQHIKGWIADAIIEKDERQQREEAKAGK